MNLDEPRPYPLGLVFGAISALLWSSSGLFIRHIGTDVMTMLFWRGLLSGTCVFLFFVYLECGRVHGIVERLGWLSVWTMIFSAASMVTDRNAASGGLFGTFLAAVMTLCVAAMATLMCKHRGVPMLPAMAGSAWLCSFLTFWFAALLTVTMIDVRLIILFAIVLAALFGHILYEVQRNRAAPVAPLP